MVVRSQRHPDCVPKNSWKMGALLSSIRLGMREGSGLRFHPTRRPSWMLVQKANQTAFYPI